MVATIAAIPAWGCIVATTVGALVPAEKTGAGVQVLSRHNRIVLNQVKLLCRDEAVPPVAIYMPFWKHLKCLMPNNLIDHENHGLQVIY